MIPWCHFSPEQKALERPSGTDHKLAECFHLDVQPVANSLQICLQPWSRIGPHIWNTLRPQSSHPAGGAVDHTCIGELQVTFLRYILIIIIILRDRLQRNDCFLTCADVWCLISLEETVFIWPTWWQFQTVEMINSLALFSFWVVLICG